MNEFTSVDTFDLEEFLQAEYAEAFADAVAHNQRISDLLAKISLLESTGSGGDLIETYQELKVVDGKQKAAITLTSNISTALFSLMPEAPAFVRREPSSVTKPEVDKSTNKEHSKNDHPRSNHHKAKRYKTRPHDSKKSKSGLKSTKNKDKPQDEQAPAKVHELRPNARRLVVVKSLEPEIKTTGIVVSRQELQQYGRQESHIPPSDVISCLLGEIDISAVQPCTKKELNRGYNQVIEREDIKKDKERLAQIAERFHSMQAYSRVIE